MTTASIPRAYVVGTFPATRSLIASARTVLVVVFGLWPLSATMLAVASVAVSMLASQ